MKPHGIYEVILISILACEMAVSAQTPQQHERTDQGSHAANLQNPGNETSAMEPNTPGLTKVTNANKASKLIGMEVRDPQGEELGRLQDLVVDLKSGKISYAVLSTGGFLGVGEKYLAIPADAFDHAVTGDYLVLHVEKHQIEGAHGFPKTNWPAPNNPIWGANNFWKMQKPSQPGLEKNQPNVNENTPSGQSDQTNPKP